MRIFGSAISVFILILIGASCVHKSKNTVSTPESSYKRPRGLASEGRSSLEEQLRSIDPRKKTVCTITINSEDETRLFRERLSSFNFLELTSSTGDWFKKACDNRVQCDVVLISGHFGGTFFGESGLRLSLAELEERSCHSDCSGIFGKASEVFLFGCNTLAGKEKDRRTPEEYIRVLMDDGFSRAQAEQVAGFRYSPIGTSFRDRMSSVFYGAKRIYGFDSIGPSGKTIEPMLKKYFSWAGDYEGHLSKLKSTTRPNTPLAKALATTSFAEARGIGGTAQSAPLCVLTGEQSRLEKLQWILAQLKDPQTFIESSSYIKMFFGASETARAGRLAQLTSEESEVWDRIRHDFPTKGKSKARVYSLLDRPLPGVVAMQSELASLALSLEWATKPQYHQWMKRLIGDLKQPMTLERKDYICSLGATMELGLDDLPPSPWPALLTEAITCLKPQNQDIPYTLLTELLEERVGNPQFQSGWIDFDEDGEAAVSLLYTIPARDSRAQRLILEGLQSKNQRKRELAVFLYPAEVFSAQTTRRLMVPFLQDPSSLIRHWALNKLYGAKVLTTEILGERLLDTDMDMVIKAMDFLTDLKLWNRELILQAVEMLRDPRLPIWNNAYIYLKKLKITDPEILAKIREARPSFFDETEE